MELGILGLPASGKTTVFQALAAGHVEQSSHGSRDLIIHNGVVKVPDPRLDALAGLFKPDKVVPADVRYVDFSGPAQSFTRGQGLPRQLVSALSQMDALVHVVRAFRNEAVPHLEGTVQPERDVATMDLELAYSDLALVERRLERLEATIRGAPAAEREALLRDKALFERLKQGLEDEAPIREQGLGAEEVHGFEGFGFLTQKPLVLLFNLGEEQLGDGEALEASWRQRYSRPHTGVVALCGRLERELAELTGEEADEFRRAMGVPEAGLERVIRESYAALDIVSFFTVASDEVRCWPIPAGMPAVKAAGRIHSDMERGFIRAEVLSEADLLACGSLSEARHRGLLRAEGKTYIVQDGDVITFLFNV